jgi:hypothetical protein
MAGSLLLGDDLGAVAIAIAGVVVVAVMDANVRPFETRLTDCNSNVPVLVVVLVLVLVLVLRRCCCC